MLRAERWRLLLRPVGDVPRWPAVAATFIGFGANAVLPLRLGEFVRPFFLSRRVGLSLSPTISSIVLERIFDTLLVVCCLLGVSAVYPVDERLRQGAVLLGVVMAAGMAFLIWMQRSPTAAERLIRGVLSILPERVREPLWSIAEGLQHGLGALSDLSIVVRVMVYSVVLWGMITITYTLSFLALDVPIPMLAGSLVTVVIVAASVFIPQGPGFIGTWQAGCVLALHTVFGVPRDIAVSYSFLTWVIQMVSNVGAASVGLLVEGVSLGDLVREGRREVPEG